MHNKNINTTNREQTSESKKWITFTYTGKETRMITRLLKNYHVKIAYKTNNTISDYLRQKNRKPDKYESSGIYELRCKSCPRKYIGQTGRNFKTRYREHILAIRNNNSAASKYAQHTLETGHEYGKMEDILTIIQREKKGRRLNSLEQFYIHRLVKEYE
jgi:hypothetical protein